MAISHGQTFRTEAAYNSDTYRITVFDDVQGRMLSGLVLGKALQLLIRPEILTDALVDSRSRVNLRRS